KMAPASPRPKRLSVDSMIDPPLCCAHSTRADGKRGTEARPLRVDLSTKHYLTMRIPMRISMPAWREAEAMTMSDLYDPNAPKKPTNLSINSDLLTKTRALNINLSATLEQALSKELARAKAATWAEENKAAIIAYNAFVEEHGCFGDEFREF